MTKMGYGSSKESIKERKRALRRKRLKFMALPKKIKQRRELKKRREELKKKKKK